MVSDIGSEFDETDYPLELDIEIQLIVLFATNEALQVTSRGRKYMYVYSKEESMIGRHVLSDISVAPVKK